MTAGLLLTTTTAVAALLVAGCRPDTERSANTLTVLYPASEWLLGPAWDDSPKFLMFLPLVNYGEDSPDCGELKGALAERWEHSSDYRVWTAWLRPNVRWHDGVPVAAEDIRFTMDLLKHPAVHNYNAGPVDSVVVLDPHTVRFFLSKPDQWPQDGWATFFPKHLLERLDPKGFYEWEFWTHPVGNGPYRYVRHVPQTMMELEATPDYYRGKPRIERLVLRFTAAGSGGGLIELRSGGVDLALIANLLEAAALATDPRFRAYYRVSSSHSRWLAYNPLHRVFQDRRVRRALTLAIDRRALHSTLGFPENVPITDAPYYWCQFEQRDLAPPLPYDPGEAGRLLEAAGWTTGNGDAVRSRDGISLRFTTIVAGEEERAALVIQNQLRRLGVRMDVQRLDLSLVRERAFRGDFEAAVIPTVNIEDWLERDSSLVQVYPRLVKLVRARSGLPDFASMDRVYDELRAEFLRELPGTFLYPTVGAIVAHRRVRGLERDGYVRSGWRWPFGGVEFLWIEEP